MNNQKPTRDEVAVMRDREAFKALHEASAAWRHLLHLRPVHAAYRATLAALHGCAWLAAAKAVDVHDRRHTRSAPPVIDVHFGCVPRPFVAPGPKREV